MTRDLRISSLDGLRGIAASVVVYSHLGLFVPSAAPWKTLHVGDEAVAIFFALSGFLMALLYSNRPVDAGNYLVHRFARIYPVYLAAVLFTFLLSTIFADYIQPIGGSVQLLRHLVMFGSSGVFWSIPPEIQFYLFFLLLWLWFRNPADYQFIGVLTAVALCIDAYFGFPGPGILLSSKLPYFLFGALAGRLFVLQKSCPDGAITGIAVLSLLVFFLLSRGLFPNDINFWGLSSAFIGAVIVYLAACSNWLSEMVLGSRPLVFIGKISFSLYLFHIPVIFLGMHLLSGALPLGMALAVSVIFAYLFAWVSNTMIEEPSRRFLTGLWKVRQRRLPVAAE